MKKVIKYYNENQDEIKVKMTALNTIIITHATDNLSQKFKLKGTYEIGFYEWLFNPKYKVWDVFKIGEVDYHNIKYETIEYIMKYLGQQIN